MTMGIYIIIDQAGKPYIGSAVNIERRWSAHRFDLRNNRHTNGKLQNAWNKYGESYFTFDVVELVQDKSQLIVTEQLYLDKLFNDYVYDQHYNILPVAANRLGSKHTDSAKAKMSVKASLRRGRPVSSETRAKLSITGAKTYVLLSPDNVVTTITNMKQFCRDNNLNAGHMIQVFKGNRKQHKGWAIYNG